MSSNLRRVADSCRLLPGKTGLLLCLALIFFFGGVCFAGPLPSFPAKAAVPQVVSSASEIAYPPFSVVTPENQADGFSVELLRATLEAMGREVVFEVGLWNEVKQRLADGRADVLPLVGRTPEREDLFDFTFPYLTMHGTIVVRENQTDIRDLADLEGKQIAVMKGDNAEEFLRRSRLDATIVATPSFEEALKQLANGDHDAVVIQKLLALQLIDSLQLTSLRTVGPPLEQFVQSFCFAVREGDHDLLALLNEGLSIVIADGTFKRLQKKWFGPIKAREMRKSRIVVGGDFDYPPYEFLDQNGQPTGYNVDLTRALGRQMGVDVVIELRPWAEVRTGLDRGAIDAVQGMFYSPERHRVFDFSPPHTHVSHVIVARQGATLPRDMAELAGRTILVMEGDIMHDEAVEQGYSAQLLIVKSQEEALQQLANGRGDCALVAKVPALYWIEKHGLTNLRINEEPVLTAEYCYAVPQGDHALMAKLSEGLAAIKATGEYRQIYARWLGVYEEPALGMWDALRYLAFLLIPIVLILFGSIVWNWSLKRRVGRATVQLEDERQRLASIIEGTRAGTWEWNLQTGNILVNRVWAGMIGYTLEEISPVSTETIKKYIHPGDIQYRKDRLDAHLQGVADFYECEFRMKHQAGHWVWVLGRGKVASWTNDGKPLWMFGTNLDITQIKQAEKELLETRNILQAAMDQSPAGIVIFDAQDGQVRYVNDAWLNIRGWTHEEVFNKEDAARAVGAWQLLDLDGRPLASEENPLLRAIRFGDTSSQEFIIPRGYGDECIVLGNAAPILNETGQIKAGIAVFTDITKQKAAESEAETLQSQLHRVQRMEAVGRLAGGIAHDYNNILSVIIGFTELAQIKAGPTSPLQECLAQILKAALRSRDITQQLLIFARKQTIHPKIVDINLQVESSLKILKHVLGENIDLAWRPKQDLWPVEIDPSQFEQILTNLCINARDAIVDVGKVTVETNSVSFDQDYCREHVGFLPGDYVVLAVSDNGCGMDRETLDQIFDPFFTTKEEGKGTGLGLAMVYGAIKQNNGFITVYSEPGHGTTFRIYLPRHFGPADELDEAVEIVDLVGNGRTVLVVEDDSAILGLIESILDQSGFNVLTADSPTEALRVARSCSDEIELLISDVIMPEMNGREMAAQLTSLYPDLKALYMSGYTADVIAHHGIILDKNIHFIHKPFSRNDLGLQVKKALDGDI